jgi:superfamily II DNA or RNA helicase
MPESRPLILFCKALQAGERWVTIRPNGPDSKGQPILIQPQPDGSAKVVGGAGGSLNHMRLTGVKPAGEYADTIRERAKGRREKAKAQRERDKQLGIHTAKAEAHKQVTDRTRQAQREYVDGVAKAMGWDEADYKFDPAKAEGQPDHVVAKLQQAHELSMVKRADAAVKLNRERLLADAGARAEADLGEVPLDSDSADELSVQDIDPVRTGSLGLGFATDYKARAEENGADEAAIKDEAAGYKKEPSEGARKAAIKNGETARLVRENLELLREPDQAEKLAPKLVEAKQALELLKLDKRRKLAEKQARDTRKKINESVEEPKAYVLEVDDAKVDEKVAEDVANDLRTISTRTFLSEVGKMSPNPVADLGRHIGSGAYNSVNALALAAGGAALVDRSVVDVLGIAGAAEVLSRRLATDLTPEEYKDVADGAESFHLHHYMEASEEAIGQARELQAHAREMELGEAENGGDLTVMQEINRRRADAIGQAQKVLGTALGEMEANAALVFALRRGKSDKPFQVSLGNVAVESAIQQVRALGLQRGDYTLETVAGNRVLKVLPHGMDRLAQPVNRADLEQVRRNLDIIGGKEDEDGWLPLGISDRPDLDLKLKPGIAPSLAQPFEPGADLEAAARSYIGGRMADGDAPADIVSDLQSAEFMQRVGFDRAGEYREALDKIAPLADQDGKLRQVEALRSDFEKMADEFCADRGFSRAPLHRQTFDADHHSIEALHRALAAEPTGVAAYKQIGELTPQDQGALREFFAKHVARETPEAAGLRHDLEAMPAKEPERQTKDMFGDTVTNPEWTSWKSKRDDLAAKVGAASMNWSKYVEAMRGPERAYAAMQDSVRSHVSKAFADTYNTLNPGKPLKVGRATIRDNLNHLDAVDPKAREARMAKERALSDGLRNRAQGRYAAGGVRDKLDAAREEQAGLEAAQMGFFADEPAAATERPLDADERWTVGHEAERKIAELMPAVGQNFKPGQPVNMFRPTMSGGKNWPRQRAIKMVEANKKAILSFGTGSGKTLIGLGAFTHLHGKGKATRGLFLAPSIAQGNFGADALRFLEPGKFKWHCKPGASRDERIAAYKDPSNHFAVMTHQAFRDDMVHLGAAHAGTSEEDMTGQLAKMGRSERKDWLAGVMRREGINFDYLNVDEGHDLLNRIGKENSTLANVVDAFGDHVPYSVNSSADPIKNTVDEAFDLLSKMDPERYTDRPAFMRKYGVDTLAAKDSLRREMARFQYPSKIDPDITATKSERRIQISDGQRTALSDLDKSVAAARIARMQGKVDIAAMKAVSPSSFAGVSDDQHEAVARDLQQNLGILKQTAVRKVLDSHPTSGKMDEVVRVARERPGKQGVVFAHSLDAVEALRDRLTKEGYRVATISGRDSAKEKAKRIAEYRPANGESNIDVMVCSDAGATGANLQSGQWCAQFDTPDTAKTWCQRAGRVNRIGQENNVDLIDLVSDHPEEQKRRDRLVKKNALRDLMTTPMEGLDDTGVAYWLTQRRIARENGGLL